MNDHYVSPYGFGPITDAVIDCVAARRGLTVSEMEDAIGKVREDGEESVFDVWAETEWWTSHMGPAIDAMEDHLSKYLEAPDGS